MRASEMLQTHPQVETVAVDRQALIDCIEACYRCAQTCTACADACLGESMVEELVACIRLNLDCADVCAATGNLLSRQTSANWQLIQAQLRACATACQLCGAECERHADMHEHCRVCAEMCRQCEDACRRLLN